MDVIFDTKPSSLNLQFDSDIRPVIGGGVSSDYTKLSNKPSINGVVLEGNKTNEEIDIGRVSNLEIEEMFRINF